MERGHLAGPRVALVGLLILPLLGHLEHVLLLDVLKSGALVRELIFHNVFHWRAGPHRLAIAHLEIERVVESVRRRRLDMARRPHNPADVADLGPQFHCF